MLAYVVYYRYQDLLWAWFLLLALKAIKMLITFSACTKDNKANPFFSHFPVDKCTLGLKANVSQKILNWHSLRHSHSAEICIHFYCLS